MPFGANHRAVGADWLHPFSVIYTPGQDKIYYLLVSLFNFSNSLKFCPNNHIIRPFFATNIIHSRFIILTSVFFLHLYI